MTTNKEAAIPPELYRPGRIDSEIYFNKLDAENAMRFAQELADKMSFIMPLDLSGVSFIGEHPQADVTETVISEMKYQYLTKMEGQS